MYISVARSPCQAILVPKLEHWFEIEQASLAFMLSYVTALFLLRL